tara:strand:- start:1776 stop:2201 length:426 start_codon:yes stop_codon:yes gene_type:complete
MYECIHHPGEMVTKRHCEAAHRKAKESPNGRNILPKCWDCEKITEKTCRRCGEIKPHLRFPASKNSKDGYEKTCRDCRTELNKEKRHSGIGPKTLSVVLVFRGEYDREIWKKLSEMAKKDRRTVEGEAMWLVEKAVEGIAP